ncbi:MAG: fructose-6-phosphate aldolase [Candidatus Latescibacteria bacterium]|jgi:transaldolase|nr:fructose-6-phosphate aldolase [Candidatus Latescibacterota bacterium]MBT5830606.1 fructose-6-phosphate aldolase [Candidatus Latescibacterota bacterium]
MQFFVDTANIDEIKEAQAMGVLDGVTTNPSLMSKESGNFDEIIREICEIVDGPVSAEVVSTDFDGMMAEARKNAAIHEQVVVKIPIILDGLKAVKACSNEGIRTNVTLCFSPTQALMAAKAGASYISPFIGRLDDLGQDGMDLIATIRQIYNNYGFETQVLAASLRSTKHVVECALAGADVVTLPPDVLKKLLTHPLTDSGLERFLADWKSWEEGKK